jgi:hypothetical protein
MFLYLSALLINIMKLRRTQKEKSRNGTIFDSNLTQIR